MKRETSITLVMLLCFAFLSMSLFFAGTKNEASMANYKVQNKSSQEYVKTTKIKGAAWLNLNAKSKTSRKSPKAYVKLTPDSVYAEFVKNGIIFPEVVLQKSIVETGWFKHTPGNNLFGFRVTKAYMSFKSWKHCVEYYKTWQDKKWAKYVSEGGDVSNYYSFIRWSGWKDGKKYSKASLKYVNYIKQINVDKHITL